SGALPGAARPHVPARVLPPEHAVRRRRVRSGPRAAPDQPLRSVLVVLQPLRRAPWTAAHRGRRAADRAAGGVAALPPRDAAIPPSSTTCSIPVGFFSAPCTFRIPSYIINPGLYVAAIPSGGNNEIQGPIPARLFSEVAVDRVTLKGTPAGAFGLGLVVQILN